MDGFIVAGSREERAKPIIKWAGGKGQLLDQIRSEYPDGLGDTITRYAEPFIGGAAVLLDVLSSYDIEEAYISDINRELVNLYIDVRDNPDGLIELLSDYESDYLSRDSESRKTMFYEKRDRFNELKKLDTPVIETSALFIFLNRTCFNGLYRVNANGDYNVPTGKYKKPMICDKPNLMKVSELLQGVIIRNATYLESRDFIDERTFAYFDPPYRPLNITSSFTSYTKEQFDDEDQITLGNFVKELVDKKHAKVMLSNSDPKNTDPNDNFFDDLYAGLNIKRISASRAINSKGDGRGKINELLVTSYETSRKRSGCNMDCFCEQS